MSVSRRSFLRGLLASSAAVAIPVPLPPIGDVVTSTVDPVFAGSLGSWEGVRVWYYGTPHHEDCLFRRWLALDVAEPSIIDWTNVRAIERTWPMKLHGRHTEIVVVDDVDYMLDPEGEPPRKANGTLRD